MTDASLKGKVVGLFLMLRQSGFNLGVGELLAAVRALQDVPEGGQDEALRRAARLLWCSSVEAAREFEAVWERYAAEYLHPLREDIGPAAAGRSGEAAPDYEDTDDARQPAPVGEESPERHPAQALAGLTAYTRFISASVEGGESLSSYWPLSRRSMIYGWRYLRQPIPDGPAELLDVETTVNQAARLGFFLSPVYRRREVNHAHLLLFVDQDGSMVPFHRFTREIVETALNESDIETREVVYFNNVPSGQVFLDPFLTESVPLAEVLARCSGETSVLVVSDAGAARGFRRMERVRATAVFLALLGERTGLAGWLNPMPKERWQGTSAFLISSLVPMFQMNSDGFSAAIDVVRGQSFRH